VKGELDALLATSEDPPLKDAVDDFLAVRTDERYEHGMRKLKSVAPAGATASWVTEPDNYRRLGRLYRERELSPDTERRELTGVFAFVASRFGDGARARRCSRRNPLDRRADKLAHALAR
jgi:hypothetical protein